MKMAGTIPKVIDDGLLRCQLCMKSFTNPKLLPCLHSFCEKCLTRYVQTVVGSNKEKQTSAQRQSHVLDAKVVEEAVRGSGLDREIPVHGYDDVVGSEFPSLPRLSIPPRTPHQSGPLFKQLNTRTEQNNSLLNPPQNTANEKEHEYSEIPATGILGSEKRPKSGAGGSSNTMEKVSDKTSEKDSAYSSSEGIVSPVTPSTPLSPQYLPMSRPLRSRSDPIQENFQLPPELLEGNKQKSQSARSSKVTEKMLNCDMGGQNGTGANVYIPMGSSPSNLNQLTDDSPSSPVSPGVTYETMDTSHEGDDSIDNDNNGNDTYLPNNISPKDKLQSANLTGFGSIGSPPVMPLFKKTDTKTTDPVYQLEKSVSVKEKSKSSKKGPKFPKLRSSKSVDVLSGVPDVYVDKCSSKDNVANRQSSDSDLKDNEAEARPLSGHMVHSVSTPYMASSEPSTARNSSAIPENESVHNTSSGSVHEAWANDILTYSPSCDHDGYETPINKRKLLSTSPQFSELEIDTNIPVEDDDLPDSAPGVPSLPPKLGGGNTPIPPARTNRGNSALARSKSDESSKLIQRRKGVSETMMFPSPSKSEPEGARLSVDGTAARDSVFDHIYEEIQCDENNVPLHLHNSKGHKNVPMLTSLSTNSAHMHTLLRKHQGNKYGTNNTENHVSPSTQKVQKLLKKSNSTTESFSSGQHEIPVVSLQLGNKLMRKSQSLLDDNGFSYINDQFEKVHIHHNDEDIELIYSEVCDIEEIPSSSSYNTVEKRLSSEIPCPICSSVFTLPDDHLVSSLPNSTFIENLKETRDIENTLKPNCKDCGKNIKADFKCLECDSYLCKKCNDSHNWFKVVKGHQVMTLAQLQSGMFTNQIMSKKQDVCPNHSSEAPQYYCDTCSMSICKECSHCYHTGHRCQPIEDVAKRGTAYLHNFQSMTGHMSHTFKAENLQLDKYRIQYNNEKQKAITDITNQYVRARDLLDDAYQELMRHIDFRYSEEALYLEDLQRRNDQFVNRVEQSNKLADHVTEYGNQSDIINTSNVIASNLLKMEKCTPYRMVHKMDIQFHPLASVRPIDILPLLGQANREYKPIKRRETQDSSPGIPKENRASKQPITHVTTITPKTQSDKKGCKPTGIALTKEDNIVIVDDINRKIKIFNDEGDLIREIVPQNKDELVDPWDVTVTNYGNFAVTDRGSKQVKIFDPDGDLVCHFGPHLGNPWGICCNKDGDLIVTDTDHKCIFVNDSNGNLKYRIDPPAKMAKFPEYVTTNSYGDIIVSDLKGHCIYVFNLIGQFLFKVGPQDPHNPRLKLLHSPCGIYSDQEDNILVADYEMMRVTKFNKNGRFISHFLTFMDNLRAPQSLIVNKKDHVIILDGNFIKIFTAGEFELWDIEKTTTETDLELKPKVYNIRKSRKLYKEPEMTRSLSDGEDEEKGELIRNDKQRKTIHNTPVRRTDHVKVRKSRLAVTNPGSRSSSVPPKSNHVQRGSHSNAFKAVINYDTPQVSVQRIKQKLSSLDRSDSSSSSPRSSASPDKVTKPPLFKTYETSKVSVGKVKEQLLSHSKQPASHSKVQSSEENTGKVIATSSNSVKPVDNSQQSSQRAADKDSNKSKELSTKQANINTALGTKPKLGPKPSFKVQPPNPKSTAVSQHSLTKKSHDTAKPPPLSQHSSTKKSHDTVKSHGVKKETKSPKTSPRGLSVTSSAKKDPLAKSPRLANKNRTSQHGAKESGAVKSVKKVAKKQLQTKESKSEGEKTSEMTDRNVWNEEC